MDFPLTCRRSEERLTIPHPRWAERGFVKAPLADLAEATGASHPSTRGGSKEAGGGGHVTGSSGSGGGGLAGQLHAAAERWRADDGGEAALGSSGLQCVMPMGRLGLWPWQQRTWVMGILNVTPDSFRRGERGRRLRQQLRPARS